MKTQHLRHLLINLKQKKQQSLLKIQTIEDAKAAVEVIKSQWDLCLKERRRKYEQHLEKAHMCERKTKSRNTEVKWAAGATNSKSKPRKPLIVFEDINTSYTQSIKGERIKARRIQKNKSYRSNSFQDQDQKQKRSQFLINSDNNKSQARGIVNNNGIRNSSKSENRSSSSSKSNSNSNNNHQNRSDGSTTIILGDSMIKNIAAWRLRKRMEKKDHLFIHSLPGATISDMTSYCIPSVNKAPDKIILHRGTNDLSSNRTEVHISTEMITLGHSIKAKGINVVISGFLRRGDSLESKRAETKAIIGDMCKEEDVKYMEHENMNIEHHNGSLLHLNKYGDSVLPIIF